MVNHRPLQKQYKQKETVKRMVLPVITVTPSVDISKINISDMDRFGNKIKRGTGSGGSATSRKWIDPWGFTHYDNSCKKIKKAPHKEAAMWIKGKRILINKN